MFLVAQREIGVQHDRTTNRFRLQRETLRNIVLAWVLTVPAAMLLGSVLFAASLFAVLQLAG